MEVAMADTDRGCRDHNWWITPATPGGETSDTIQCSCMPSGWGETFFVPAKRLSAFHDQDLAELTEQLSALLEPYRKKGEQRGLELGILQTKAGQFLAWTVHSRDVEDVAEQQTQLKSVAIASSTFTSEEDRDKALIALGIELPPD